MLNRTASNIPTNKVFGATAGAGLAPFVIQLVEALAGDLSPDWENVIIAIVVLVVGYLTPPAMRDQVLARGE